jgi:hypothetical protein
MSQHATPRGRNVCRNRLGSPPAPISDPAPRAGPRASPAARTRSSAGLGRPGSSATPACWHAAARAGRSRRAAARYWSRLGAENGGRQWQPDRGGAPGPPAGGWSLRCWRAVRRRDVARCIVLCLDKSDVARTTLPVLGLGRRTRTPSMDHCTPSTAPTAGTLAWVSMGFALRAARCRECGWLRTRATGSSSARERTEALRSNKAAHVQKGAWSGQRTTALHRSKDTDELCVVRAWSQPVPTASPCTVSAHLVAALGLARKRFAGCKRNVFHKTLSYLFTQ